MVYDFCPAFQAPRRICISYGGLLLHLCLDICRRRGDSISLFIEGEYLSPLSYKVGTAGEIVTGSSSSAGSPR